jgi:hypothetical protein
MRSAHTIIGLGDGKVLAQGNFEKLSSMKGYFSDIVKLDRRKSTTKEEEEAPLIQAVAQQLQRKEPVTTRADPKRQTGDLTIYSYYSKFAGRINVLLTIGIDVAAAFCALFSSKLSTNFSQEAADHVFSILASRMGQSQQPPCK